MSVDLEAIEKLCDKQTFTAYGSEVLLGSLADEVPGLIAEVRKLRAERDATLITLQAAENALEWNQARVAELERLGNAMAECQTLGPTERERKEAWRKAVRGKALKP